MENKQILKTLLLLLLCLPLSTCTGQEDTEPTAIVIDAETGRPIEGAVALAQWYKSASLGLGMGATLNLVKAAEAFSDRKGQVYIADFWKSQKFNWRNRRQPRLTIYKPGYVLWDSEEICPVGQRRDFDSDFRTAKLLKFDTEASKWHTKNPIYNGPRSMHNSFFSSCYESGEKFQNIFRENELPLLKKEEEKARLFEKSLELRHPFDTRGGGQIWPDNYIGKYTDLGNGIIRDSVSGLEWQQATAPGTYNWGQALDYCDNLNIGGYQDWRLPTIHELKTLIDRSTHKQFRPYINPTYFRDTVEAFYWTSSTGAGCSNKIEVAVVDFLNISSRFCSFKDRSLYVRCVRWSQ